MIPASQATTICPNLRPHSDQHTGHDLNYTYHQHQLMPGAGHQTVDQAARR